MNSFDKPNVDVPFQGSPPIDLLVEDLIVGDGAECEAGQIISVDYVGISWSTGIEFDSSWSRNEVFAFSLGGGQVISGWDEGCSGMRVGGRRKLIIPPENKRLLMDYLKEILREILFNHFFNHVP